MITWIENILNVQNNPLKYIYAGFLPFSGFVIFSSTDSVTKTKF